MRIDAHPALEPLYAELDRVGRRVLPGAADRHVPSDPLDLIARYDACSCGDADGYSVHRAAHSGRHEPVLSEGEERCAGRMA